MYLFYSSFTLPYNECNMQYCNIASGRHKKLG